MSRRGLSDGQDLKMYANITALKYTATFVREGLLKSPADGGTTTKKKKEKKKKKKKKKNPFSWRGLRGYNSISLTLRQSIATAGGNRYAENVLTDVGACKHLTAPSPASWWTD